MKSRLYIYDGRISCANKHFKTQWHGSAQHEGGKAHRLQLLFHHQGKEDNMGKVRLYKLNSGDGKEIWKGRDYAYRNIRMERLASWTYNRETRTWDHKPDPLSPEMAFICEQMGWTWPRPRCFEIPPSFPPPDP